MKVRRTLEKGKAYELLAAVEEAGKQGQVREIGNGEHVVVLKKRHWHLWSAEDWQKFLESEGNKQVDGSLAQASQAS